MPPFIWQVAKKNKRPLRGLFCFLRRLLYNNTAIIRWHSKIKTHQNPKCRQREVKKQCQQCGLGTKSQQALSTQHELMKVEKKKARTVKKRDEKLRQFELKQRKK